jgi:hypothetical protein
VCQVRSTDSPSYLRIAALSVPEGGRPIFVSDAAALPEWVPVSTEANGSFSLRLRGEGDTVVIEWEAHARYSGGAGPPAFVRAQAHQETTGGVVVDLASGHVRMLSGHTVVTPDSRSRPPCWVERDPAAEPWVAGMKRVALVWSEADGELSVGLASVDMTTGESQTMELTRGRALVARVTADGKYVFVHSDIRPGGDTPWRVYSGNTGEHVANLTYDPGARWPTVLDQRVYYVVETAETADNGKEATRISLKARELATDRLAWELVLATIWSARPPPMRP